MLIGGSNLLGVLDAATPWFTSEGACPVCVGCSADSVDSPCGELIRYTGDPVDGLCRGLVDWGW